MKKGTASDYKQFASPAVLARVLSVMADAGCCC